MRTRALFLCGAFALAACGSSSSGSEAQTQTDSGADGSTPAKDSSTGSDTRVDETSSSDSSAVGDSSSVDASSDSPSVDSSPVVDAPDDALVAHPPAGYTKCAGGPISTADARAACLAPSFVLDDGIGPDGGHFSVERQCDAVTFTAGAWEAWCGAGGVYLRAQFDGVQPNGSYVSCPGISDLETGLGYYDAAAGSGGAGGTVSEIGTPTYFFNATTPTSLVMEERIDDATYVSGAGHLFFAAQLAIMCDAGHPAGMPGPNVVVLGAALEWPK